MPTISLHPRPAAPIAITATASHPINNPLPQLLQTPSGLAILELQGTINVPSLGDGNDYEIDSFPEESQATFFETPIGKLIFPDYSPQNPDDTKWMKRVHFYIGRYQRMTGEVKKLVRPIAIIQKRPSTDVEELEIVEIVRYKVFFKNRPEPVNDL